VLDHAGVAQRQRAMDDAGEHRRLREPPSQGVEVRDAIEKRQDACFRSNARRDSVQGVGECRSLARKNDKVRRKPRARRLTDHAHGRREMAERAVDRQPVGGQIRKPLAAREEDHVSFGR